MQAIVKILAEPPLADRSAEVDVGGADHARIHLDRVAAADAVDRALLQEAQQMRLLLERQIADLVEEDRAAMRGFEPPDAALAGAGEGALLMAEELGSDEAGRQRRAVDGDEGPFAIGRALMDRAGNQLLAGAALAGDQHRRVGRAELADLIIDPLHARAVAYHERLRILSRH